MHNLAVPENEDVFNNISQCMLRLGETFQKHDVKVSWGVMEYFAEAIKKFQTKENNLLRELERMGHEIGVHSIAYEQDPSDILINDLGFEPEFSCPGIMTQPDFNSQLKLIEDVFLSRDYRILTGHFGWAGYSDYELIYAWQPSLNPAVADFTHQDPNSSILAINQQGGGWVGANDVDMAGAGHFKALQTNSRMNHFIENSGRGDIIVYPVAVHEDLFTTGQLMRDASEKLEEEYPLSECQDNPVLMQQRKSYWEDICLKTHCDSEGNCADQCVARDTSCSDSAIQALDNYLTEVMDPLMAEGKIVSKTYSEIYDIYFGTNHSTTPE